MARSAYKIGRTLAKRHALDVAREPEAARMRSIAAGMQPGSSARVVGLERAEDIFRHLKALGFNAAKNNVAGHQIDGLPRGPQTYLVWCAGKFGEPMVDICTPCFYGDCAAHFGECACRSCLAESTPVAVKIPGSKEILAAAHACADDNFSCTVRDLMRHFLLPPGYAVSIGKALRAGGWRLWTPRLANGAQDRRYQMPTAELRKLLDSEAGDAALSE